MMMPFYTFLLRGYAKPGLLVTVGTKRKLERCIYPICKR